MRFGSGPLLLAVNSPPSWRSNDPSLNPSTLQILAFSLAMVLVPLMEILNFFPAENGE